MNIRFATEADIQQINSLRKQVSELHVQGKPEVFRPGFGDALQQHIHTLLKQENHAILVAETAEGIVGFACVKFVDSPGSPYRLPMRYLDVDEFGVDAAHRRQGIGRALFDEIRSLAREHDLNRIELNMWEFNESAKAFYEAIGFATYRRYMEYNLE